MKTVYLLRHAKSSWDDPEMDDFERPLAPRGRKAAPRMGRYMAREGFIPARVLCSGARRAQETWGLVSGSLEQGVPVEIRRDIYHASPNTLLDLIQALPDELDSVLLVGHNPAFEELALLLAGDGDSEALDSLDRKYPTGALAVLDFTGESWKKVKGGRGYLRAFVRPKALR